MTEGVLPLSRQLHSAQYGTWWMLDTNNGEFDGDDDRRGSGIWSAPYYYL